MSIEIHVLYDSRPQPDKLPPLLRELDSQNLQPAKIWEPVPAKTVVESINLSFKQIIRYAKESNLPYVCICEDDLMFTCSSSWHYFIDSMPESFDIFVGGNYLINDPDKTLKAPHYKVNEYVGNQLIIVANRYYDTFLSVPDAAHVDTAQKGLGEFYACFPMVALQRPGFSSNSMQVVNYNKDLKSNWLYSGAVHHF